MFKYLFQELTLKDKGYLLAPMVQQRTFTIHGTFSFHKRFFTEK